MPVRQCVVDSPKSAHLPARLASVVDYLTRVVYTNVCFGLFQSHKLMFALLLSVSMMRRRGDLRTREWLLLLRGAISTGSGAAAGDPNPAPSRIDASSWATMVELDACGLSGLARSVSREWSAWVAWADSASPETTPLPEPWQASVTAMQRLVLIRVIRPAAIVAAATAFVVSQLGSHVVAPTVTAGLDGVLAGVDCKTPVVFILTQVRWRGMPPCRAECFTMILRAQGADPTSILLRHAAEQGFKERLHVISLGQGQGRKAEAQISAATVSGDWVLLQNCHLAKSWLPQLERVVIENAERGGACAAALVCGISGLTSGAGGTVCAGALDADSLNPSFRLFLTSFPASYFPITVLQVPASAAAPRLWRCSCAPTQAALKLTTEPPKGVRANVIRTLDMQVRLRLRRR